MLVCAQRLAQEEARRAQAEAERAKEAEKGASEQRKAAAKLRRRAVAAAAAAVIALVLLAAAAVSWRAAQEQARIADVQRAVAEERLEQARRSLYALQLFRVANTDRKDPGAAIRMLEDLRRCPLDLREFTWAYYKRLFGSQNAPQRVLGDSKIAIQR